MKKQFIYGMMAAAGLLFTGCSSEEFIQQENKPLEADQSFYVAMTITGDVPQSRAYEAADDFGGNLDAGNANHFDNGTETESKVQNVYFVFYDDNGNVVGDVVEVDISTFDKDETVTGQTVSSSYSSVVAVSVRKGEKKPSKVICYINPINSGTLGVSLNRIQTVTREQFSTGSETNQRFAMSNSVYYPVSEAANSKPSLAVEFNPEDQLFKTRSEAEDAIGTATSVTIYVERYATKLAFASVVPAEYQTATRVYAASNPDDSETPYTVTPVTLTFTPQYWAVNAQAKETYVIKSFRQESEDGILLGDNYTYGDLNKVINVNGTGVLNNTNTWDWNNPEYHRSYWGMSPAYFTAEYPEVSSDVMGEDALQVNQKYISYNELVNGAGFAANNNTPQYFRETTVGSKALNANNPAAAVASVIYVGQYSVSVNGTPVTGNPSFYTYLTAPVTIDGEEVDRPYVYFENNANGSSAVTGGESMLKRFCAQATSLFKKEDDGTYTRLSIFNAEDLQKLVGAVEVAKISDEVKEAYDGDTNTKLKLQANARTLQFKDITAETEVYILTGNGYKQIVADGSTLGNDQITLTQANISLMRQVGYAYYYTTGLGYFNIPVKHLGWYRLGNEQRNAEKIDWSKVRIGDFGMVRNHSYNVNVTEITGLASGIGGKDVPIVPPATPDDYYMAYSVKILKWAVVPTQNVKL